MPQAAVLGEDDGQRHANILQKYKGVDPAGRTTCQRTAFRRGDGELDEMAAHARL